MCSSVSFRYRVAHSMGATAAWCLIFVLLVATGSSRLLACDDGATVPDPDDNPGLVADCKVLLGLRDELAGMAYLDWESGSPISGWHGVTISGSPSRVSELKLTGSVFLELRPSGNRLTGQIPAELAQLTQLTRLRLEQNQLTGPIPPGLAQLTRLRWLSLKDNRLTGAIPPELSRLTQLHWLDLERNKLTGPIPSELSQLRQLEWSDPSAETN